MIRLLVYLLLMLAPIGANAINVTLTAKAEGGNKPTIVGATNLPDGIELMVTISRKESSYMAQSNTQVKGGTFRAGPFSQKGADLNPGTYIVEVSSPLSSLQPSSTWPIIGNDGSKLKGQYVKKSPFGGKVVEFKSTFVVGSGKSSADQDRAARVQEEKDRHAWWLASCKSNCNLEQGVAANRGEAFDWNRCYNKCISDEPVKKK